MPWIPTAGTDSPIQRVPSGFPGPGRDGLEPARPVGLGAGTTTGSAACRRSASVPDGVGYHGWPVATRNIRTRRHPVEEAERVRRAVDDDDRRRCSRARHRPARSGRRAHRHDASREPASSRRDDRRRRRRSGAPCTPYLLGRDERPAVDEARSSARCARAGRAPSASVVDPAAQHGGRGTRTAIGERTPRRARRAHARPRRRRRSSRAAPSAMTRKRRAAVLDDDRSRDRVAEQRAGGLRGQSADARCRSTLDAGRDRGRAAARQPAPRRRSCTAAAATKSRKSAARFTTVVNGTRGGG